MREKDRSAETGDVAPEAMARLDEIRQRAGDRRLAVFLDYDGTLTPIVDRPDLATLDEAMRAAIARLARQATVCVVSGRARDDVEKLVGLDGIVYAGAHGFDIRGGGRGDLVHEAGDEHVDRIARVAAALREALSGVPGALVEDKRYAVAIHYRQVDPGRVPEVEQAVDEVLAASEELRRTEGKKVIELRPDIDWDKGKAVLWLLETLDLDGDDVLPLYIGDDVTDEDAFRALSGRGLSFLVAEEPTETPADYRLADPDEVGRFLGELAELLEERGG